METEIGTSLSTLSSYRADAVGVAAARAVGFGADVAVAVGIKVRNHDLKVNEFPPRPHTAGSKIAIR